MSTTDPLGEIRSRRWFYEFDLPDGTRTLSGLPAGVESVHTTRRVMLDAALDHAGALDCSGLTAVDLACHQGWFALHLARRNFGSILGVDARAGHLEDAALMARALGIPTFATRRLDIEAANPSDIGEHDLTLMLGALYHLENPVRALRLARAVTRRLLVIETQVVPHMHGLIEWGAEPRPLQGVFGVVDETAERHAGEASLHGICLAPSARTLHWMLGRVGFGRVLQIIPPRDGYDQLVRGSRVMFAAFVE